MKRLWITGIHPVEEALKRRPENVCEIWVARKGEAIDEIIATAKIAGVPVRRVSRDKLHERVGHKKHQGVAAIIRRFEYVDLESCLKEGVEERILLLLDSVEDPQNFGSILRSAAFFGVDGVIITEHRCVSVTDAVSKVSAGALSHVPVIRVKNLVKTMDKLREAGFMIAGLDVHANESIYTADLSLPLALVVGNEHKGLRRLVREHCDLRVIIPPCGKIDSLNAAVSTAVALAEMRRRWPILRVSSQKLPSQP
ncbi:MAG: 23S rRNA (guanosine(2251)-2'-O)-methyltransferase RlmB [Deltaproteobacteria bacterium]|nr:23S rRNA (guanosine(2251)-2'-O)-methyltransferase RlmB [Deltaproteobacteria bacterium]MBW2069179.1 23S rRNA (guanosine(2251)-2'-O)-methyltransferase RlmB [Deltaproteobacteria bacterium]